VSTLRNLFTVGMPLQINRDADVLADPQKDGTTDVLALTANPPAHGGDIIRERSWVSAPTVVKLKTSTANYPADVKQRYLQLPSNFSPRVAELARQITSGITNQYDQVMAITFWLRTNIEYQLTIPAAPANRDIIEWFLFDLRQGYCNYYATSEVLMLRSLGIPARLSVGYAEGESEEQGTTFIVHRKDSHAWPEVYFENYGWIEFEPTASQPSTTIFSGVANDNTNNRPIGGNANVTDEEPTPDLGGGGGPLPAQPQNPVTIILIIAIPLSVGLLVALFFWLQRSGRLEFLKTPLPVLMTVQMESRGIHPPKWLRRWAFHARLSPMEQMFSRFSWMLLLLGHTSQPSQTPAERVAQIIAAAPNTREPAEAFLEEYHREEYSRKRGNLLAAQQANQRLWREVALGAFRRLVNG
jgi:transglutaminase-like putative cysteine protease